MNGQGNNVRTGVNYDEMEHVFINFAPASATLNAAFTELTTTNVNLKIQLQTQAEQIQRCGIKYET